MTSAGKVSINLAACKTGKQHHVVERFTLAVWYKEEPVGDVELNTNER